MATLQNLACSCFGPPTFCESIDTTSVAPDVIVLANKLSDVHYGMTVKVVETFAGDVSVGDTLTVWGDNGALCRWYTSNWAIGDTAVFAFHETDLAGNWVINPTYPPNLEQIGDYHISICGIYTLSYSAGIVTGPIDANLSSMTVTDFSGYVGNCFTPVAQAIDEIISRDADIHVTAGFLNIHMRNSGNQNLTVTLHNALGQIITTRKSRGSIFKMNTRTLPSGVLVVNIQAGAARLTRRVYIE